MILMRLADGRLLDNVFRWFFANRRVYHGSLLYGRTVDQSGNPRDPSIPWHYLYNLALRHCVGSALGNASPANLESIIKLARDLAAVFDVEMYTVYENMFGVGHSNFHKGILDRVIYDELFAFQQWQPEVAPQLFGSLLHYLSKKGCKIPVATAEQWTSFASSVIKASNENSLIVRHPSEWYPQMLTAAYRGDYSKHFRFL
jgi:hypothetical protein